MPYADEVAVGVDVIAIQMDEERSHYKEPRRQIDKKQRDDTKSRIQTHVEEKQNIRAFARTKQPEVTHRKCAAWSSS